MKTHQTKYTIGDKVFFVQNRDGSFSVESGQIERIQIGGKAFEAYRVDGHHFAERDLFTDFDEAKKRALEKHNEFFERTKQQLLEQKAPIKY